MPAKSTNIQVYFIPDLQTNRICKAIFPLHQTSVNKRLVHMQPTATAQARLPYASSKFDYLAGWQRYWIVRRSSRSTLKLGKIPAMADARHLPVQQFASNVKLESVDSSDDDGGRVVGLGKKINWVCRCSSTP
jgi:hypothetical protein